MKRRFQNIRDRIERACDSVGRDPASVTLVAVSKTYPIEDLKERLRHEFAAQMPAVSFSFEPADIVSRVMSLGAATPVEVAVSGPDLTVSRAFASHVMTGTCVASPTGPPAARIRASVGFG